MVDIRALLVEQSQLDKGEMKTYIVNSYIDSTQHRAVCYTNKNYHNLFHGVDLNKIEINAQTRAESVILICDYILEHAGVNIYDTIKAHYCVLENLQIVDEKDKPKIPVSYLFDDRYSFWLEEKEVKNIVLKSN